MGKLKIDTSRFAFVFVALSLVVTTVHADAGDDSSSKLGDAKQVIKKEDYDGAIKELTRLNDAASGDADVLNLLGYSYRKLEKFDEALDYYQQALKADPKHKGAHEYLGELYLQTNQLEKAEEQLTILDEICTFACGETVVE